jgi:hypothetical protein
MKARDVRRVPEVSAAATSIFVLLGINAAFAQNRDNSCAELVLLVRTGNANVPKEVEEVIATVKKRGAVSDPDICEATKILLRGKNAFAASTSELTCKGRPERPR